MKKIFSCFLSMLVVCFCVLGSVPGVYAADSDVFVRVAVQVDAETVKGGICWFSYDVSFSDPWEVVYIENGVMSNNVSPVISDVHNQNHCYPVTCYNVGDAVSYSEPVLLTGDAVTDAKGCVDYIDTSATAPAVIAYLYFKAPAGTDSSSLNLTFAAREGGGAVRAGVNAASEPVLITDSVQVTAGSAESVHASLKTDESVCKDEFASNTEPKGALKGVFLVLNVSGEEKEIDLAGSELSYGTDYTYRLVRPETFEDKQPATGSIEVVINGFGTLSYPVTCWNYPLGDANMDGKVSPLDSTFIRRYCGGYTNNGFNSFLADTTGDKRVTPLDSTQIRRFCGGYIDSL